MCVVEHSFASRPAGRGGADAAPAWRRAPRHGATAPALSAEGAAPDGGIGTGRQVLEVMFFRAIAVSDCRPSGQPRASLDAASIYLPFIRSPAGTHAWRPHHSATRAVQLTTINGVCDTYRTSATETRGEKPQKTPWTRITLWRK